MLTNSLPLSYNLNQLLQKWPSKALVTSNWFRELGFSHYARREDSELVLWKEPSVNLPSWFQRNDLGRKYRINSKKLFAYSEKYLTKRKMEDHTLLISSPERAAIEYVHDIPEHEGFDEGHYIFEGLFSLCPNVIEELLVECSSIKVMRLFLYLAEKSDLAWFSKVDQSKIDIGRGKREIVKGGTLNKKYQIVVPKINREK